MRKLALVLISVLLLGILVGWGIASLNFPKPNLPLPFGGAPQVSPLSTVSPEITPVWSRERVRVTRVIDGDTIEIEDGRRVRYIGINTPETVDPRKAVECFGREASAQNRELVEGKEIEMGKDIAEKDKYGRLLRYIWVENLFVNDYLIRQGFAQVMTVPPDVKYQEQLRQAEAEAQEFKRGLWKSCPLSKVVGKIGEGNCEIKGNISSTGEKIYHLPECPSWEKTVISEERGEQWFCSEVEAQAAGWRKAKNCP